MLYPERKIKAVINRLDDDIKRISKQNKNNRNKLPDDKTIISILDKEMSFIKGMKLARDRFAMLLSEEV
tara:strand:- start:186 stop:392 length:207 start_codon:yes stop_codon:yes gene_type:complete